jgi:hypothetical protein
MDIATLEAVYDELAQAIDAAGPEKTSLFLVKLALLQARDSGDLARLRSLMAEALQDL